MRHGRRSYQEVLKDKSGLSTSLAETLAGISLKVIGLGVAGGLLATLLVFWVVSTSSADTSSGYQAASVSFEKAVKESDVVIGIDDRRVGLLSDTAAGCQVQTWQNGSRGGLTTLHVDTKTVPGVCKPTTALVALGAGTTGQELLANIAAPVFTYSNLGGRVITFNSTGAPTLATGTQPAGVKLADWNDVRPYSVKLNVATLDQNTAKVAKKAELSGVTNVVNVSVAQDDLRFVPAPSTDPVPGPVRITNVTRSPTTGTPVTGTHEGVTITVVGAVCPSGPTKIDASYTQQSPSATPAVSTVVSKTLTGSATAINLGGVPNGSSGAIEVSATCIDGGVTEKVTLGYSQPVPAPVLTVRQNAKAERHDLSWTKVSTLPVQYHVEWSSTNGESGSMDIADLLSTSNTQALGTVYGHKTTYTVRATVGSVTSPDSAPVSLSNSWPSVGKPAITNDNTGSTDNQVRWNWPAVACPAGTNTQYSSAYYRQDIGLSAWSSPVSARYYTVDTRWQGYDYSVDVRARCASAVTGASSWYGAVSNGPPFTRVVDPPAPIDFTHRQSGERDLVTTPYTYCTGGASLYEWIVEASYDVIWIGGPRTGLTGWYQNQPGWYDKGWGVITSHITSPWDFPTGSRFQVRAAARCENTATNRMSGTIQDDSGVYVWK